MGISLTHIRIKNFRSLEYINLCLRNTNILIGQNNSGKSNFLKAVDIALGGSRDVSEDDIFVSKNERISRNKSAIIDILLRPIDSVNVEQKSFSDFWTSVFTDSWITTDETNGDFVGIRTVIQYDLRKNDYSIERKPIVEWNDSIDSAVVGKKRPFGNDMLDSLSSFYVDAHRDVVEDIRNKKSYFGRATSQNDLSDDLVNNLEDQLNAVNKEIVQNIPALQQTTERMASIGETVGSATSTVEIEPLARKLADLHKGMDIIFTEDNSAKFSVSQHGMGTRSWISFLTLGAYVDWHIASVRSDDDEAEHYAILTMEEPEAHLHPQAQRQLYSQILKFSGQKIVSTHSPSVLAQAELGDIIHFYKRDGKTNAVHFDANLFDKEELNRIQREVINTRGELLFSKAVVLCEGVTEEQALPLYFNEYFGCEAIFCGVNIIGIGGQNYKTFLNLIKNFSLPWFVFSDGESATIKTIKNAVKVITDENIETLKNVVILDEKDYESHLLASGYTDVIIEAINTYERECSCRCIDICVCTQNFFDGYIESRNHKSMGRYKTDMPPCEKCGQDIYDNNLRDYEGEDGKSRAVYDCCTGKRAKAKYAPCIAQRIIEQDDTNKRIPPKIRVLFDELAKCLNLSVKGEYKDD